MEMQKSNWMHLDVHIQDKNRWLFNTYMQPISDNMLQKNQNLRSCIILHHASKSMKIHDAWTGVIPRACIQRESASERERIYYAAQLLMQKHTLESPQPSCRQRKESERNRELQQEEKWEEEIFTVSVPSSKGSKPTPFPTALSLSSSVLIPLGVQMTDSGNGSSLSFSISFSLYKACCMLQKQRYSAPPPYATVLPEWLMLSAGGGERKWEGEWWK